MLIERVGEFSDPCGVTVFFCSQLFSPPLFLERRHHVPQRQNCRQPKGSTALVAPHFERGSHAPASAWRRSNARALVFAEKLNRIRRFRARFARASVTCRRFDDRPFVFAERLNRIGRLRARLTCVGVIVASF